MARKSTFSANRFIQNILDQVVKKGAVQVRAGYLKKFATDMDVIIGKEAAKLFPLIISLMGGKSNGSPYVLNIKNMSAGQVLTAQQLRPGNAKTKFHGVTWLPLSKATISRKTELAKKGKIDAGSVDRFFLQTGELRDFFKSADYRSTLGNTSTHYFEKVSTNAASNRTDFRKLLGVLRFSIFKRIAPFLEDILNGRFDPEAKMERKAFGSDIGEKLQGFQYNKSHHRPLVQPAVAYIVGQGIPNAIAREINRRSAISSRRTTR